MKKFVDRYLASGRPRPRPATRCDPCEGMGFFPRHLPKDPKADEAGYVFVRCDKCGGTGRNDGKGEAISDSGIASAVGKIKRAIASAVGKIKRAIQG